MVSDRRAGDDGSGMDILPAQREPARLSRAAGVADDEGPLHTERAFALASRDYPRRTRTR
jgi:hypothetical protein